jgi:hypothetical protein
MERNSKEYEVYKSIDFCNRYENISKNHSQFEDRLKNYSNDEVIKLISELGYKSKYIKSDNFFKIQDKILNFKFYFHICLKHGIVELIIGAVNAENDEFITGSVFGRLYRLIKYAEGVVLEENITCPVFRHYDDLREILKEAFTIYEDFKREVIKVYG